MEVLLVMANIRKPASDDMRYLSERLAGLQRRVFETAVSLLNEETVRSDKEFEERVQRKLQSGSKFIPRKRKSS